MLINLLQDLIQGEDLQPQEWQCLLDYELADEQRAIALGLTIANIEPELQTRGQLLRTLYPAFCALCDRPFSHSSLIPAPLPLITLWHLWLPLAQLLAHQRQLLGRPLIQGVLGGQGTGKTTLGRVLGLILPHLGYQMLNWSLDDLYKPYGDRLQLQAQDPRLVWRGPPGTHDVDLGIQVLDQLRQGTPGVEIAIPRFDKSLHAGMGDRTSPELVTGIDIVLFEGWFVGMRPIDSACFTQVPPLILAPISTEHDRTFARDMNHCLQTYLPLWERCDRLWVLHLPNHQLSKQWRKQAEHQMIATGKPGMTDAEIDAFVEYFWKALHPQLFIPPLLPNADLVIEINPDHSPGKVFSHKIRNDSDYPHPNPSP
jgi:D-glycerate 3-kinase